MKSKYNEDDNNMNYPKDNKLNLDKYNTGNKKNNVIDENIIDKSNVKNIDNNNIYHTNEHNSSINNSKANNILNNNIIDADKNIIDGVNENNFDNVDESSITVNVDNNENNHLCIIDKTNKSIEIINVSVGSERSQSEQEQQDHVLDNFIHNFIKKRIINLDGVDYYKQGDRLRKVISDNKEKFNLIKQAHSIGHEGVYKTYHRLAREIFWTGMSKDVWLFIKGCHKCQTCKPQPLNQFAENLSTPPGLPFSRVSLDLVGPLYTTRNGNRFIIVLVDYLTKWVEAEPLARTESSDVIKFLTNVFSRHGIPELLVTDNGPQFTFDQTKAFLDLNDVYVHYVATYHPASNGQVENRNKEISKYLRVLANRYQ